VIQPHLPIRLPCFDFTPIICPTFGGWLLKGYLTDFGCYKLSWCGPARTDENIPEAIIYLRELSLPGPFGKP